MRNTDDIPERERKERIKLMQDLLDEPYRKALIKRQTELFDDPDCHELKNISETTKSYSLKPLYRHEWDMIDLELDSFRRNMYTELIFELEDDEMQTQVGLLKLDPDYKKLVAGITYHSSEINQGEQVLDDIKNLNRQITYLIETKFPQLLNQPRVD